MTITEAASREGAATRPGDVEALFPEAKQRARQRRLGIGGAVTAGLLVLGAVIWAIGGGWSGSALTVPMSQPAFGQSVLRATTAAKGATFTAEWRDSITGGCVPDTNTAVARAAGAIDFTTRTIGFTTITTGCGYRLPTPTEVVTPGASFSQVAHFTSHGAGMIQSMQLTPKWIERTNLRELPSQWSISLFLLSPQVLSTMSAVSGPVVRGGTSKIDGVGVTEFSGGTSLDAIQARDPNHSAQPAGDLVPAASSINIKVDLWLDSQGRLVRMTVVEPLYTGINRDGSDYEEAAQVPSSVAVVKQQSARQIAITLNHFGAQAVKPPARSTISPSR